MQQASGGGFGRTVQDLLTRGLDAWAEVQVARYQPNEPRSNVQTASGQSVPTGASSYPLGQVVREYAPALLLAAVALAVVVYVARK